MDSERSLQSIDEKFGGLLREFLGDKQHEAVLSVLQKIPLGVVDFLSENVIFISDSEYNWAWSLNRSDFSKIGRGIIFLSDEIFRKTKKEMEFTISHEIAHQYLRHKSPIFNMLPEKVTERQEKEADRLAIKWGFRKRT